MPRAQFWESGEVGFPKTYHGTIHQDWSPPLARKIQLHLPQKCTHRVTSGAIRSYCLCLTPGTVEPRRQRWSGAFHVVPQSTLHRTGSALKAASQLNFNRWCLPAFPLASKNFIKLNYLEKKRFQFSMCFGKLTLLLPKVYSKIKAGPISPQVNRETFQHVQKLIIWLYGCIMVFRGKHSTLASSFPSRMALPSALRYQLRSPTCSQHQG